MKFKIIYLFLFVLLAAVARAADYPPLAADKELFLKELRAYLYDNATEEELKNLLCEQIGHNRQVYGPMSIVHNKVPIFPNYKDYCKDKKYILSSRTCRISSRNLATMLSNRFYSWPYEFEQVETLLSWSSGFLHSFLIVRHFYAKNKHLIIDPTFTQFLFSPEYESTFIHPDYNQIFVGSFDELKSTHLFFSNSSEPDNYKYIEPLNMKKKTGSGAENKK